MIILYHHILPDNQVPESHKDINAGWQFRISSSDFENHIKILKKRGFKIVDIDEYYEDIISRRKGLNKKAVLTFDDGWLDNYIYALPIIEKYGIPATFFVTTGILKSDVDCYNSYKMNLNHLEDLLKKGMTIGSHTISHNRLVDLAQTEITNELQGSKSFLEENLKIKIDFFAYPGGAFNFNVAKLVEKTGYKAALAILHPSRHKVDSLFWLSRMNFTTKMNRLGDFYRLSPFLVKVLSFRNKAIFSKLKTINDQK